MSYVSITVWNDRLQNSFFFLIAGSPYLAPNDPPVVYALDTPDRIYSDDLKDNVTAILAGMTSS